MDSLRFIAKLSTNKTRLVTELLLRICEWKTSNLLNELKSAILKTCDIKN
jgi:hypothetical protein